MEAILSHKPANDRYSGWSHHDEFAGRRSADVFTQPRPEAALLLALANRAIASG
jgi:hypothetical protein